MKYWPKFYGKIFILGLHISVHWISWKKGETSLIVTFPFQFLECEKALEYVESIFDSLFEKNLMISGANNAKLVINSYKKSFTVNSSDGISRSTNRNIMLILRRGQLSKKIGARCSLPTSKNHKILFWMVIVIGPIYHRETRKPTHKKWAPTKIGKMLYCVLNPS